MMKFAAALFVIGHLASVNGPAAVCLDGGNQEAAGKFEDRGSHTAFIELAEIENAAAMAFSVVVEQRRPDGAWQWVGRLTPFPPRQGGRFAIHLLPREVHEQPILLRFRLESVNDGPPPDNVAVCVSMSWPNP